MTQNQIKGYLTLLAMQPVALVLALVTHMRIRGPNVSDVGVPMYKGEDDGFTAGCIVIFVVSLVVNFLLRRNWLKGNRLVVLAVTIVLNFMTVWIFGMVGLF